MKKADGEQFYGGDVFALAHENTEKILKMSRYYDYSWNIWEDCPFQGQIEISAVDKATR